MALTQVKTNAIADDAVTQDKVANDAIDISEIKAGSDGELISFDASGNPVKIAAGTSGHFLKSQGDASQPVFAAIPAGVGGATGVDFNDDVKARFGTGNDLEIYHDGSNSYINEAGTGDLYIRGGVSVRITDLSDNKMFLGQDGGEAQLYYDGLQKLATKTNGTEVSGILTATSLSGRHGNIEAVTKSTGYTLVSGDEGKMIITDSDVTVPENIFAAGDVFTVVNSSGSTINITKGTGINLYTIGSSTNATTTLAEKGIAIITCFSSNDFIVGGGGVS